MGKGRAGSGARTSIRPIRFQTAAQHHSFHPSPARNTQTIYHRRPRWKRLAAASSYPRDRKDHLAEFTNPNQQGGQDNKSLLAMMVVFVAVLFGAQLLSLEDEPAGATSLHRAAALRARASGCRPQPPAAAPAVHRAGTDGVDSRRTAVRASREPVVLSGPARQADDLVRQRRKLYRYHVSPTAGAPGDQLDPEAIQRTTRAIGRSNCSRAIRIPRRQRQFGVTGYSLLPMQLPMATLRRPKLNQALLCAFGDGPADCAGDADLQVFGRQRAGDQDLLV